MCAKRREDVGNYLTVVLDDFTRLRSKCPSAAEVIELIGDQGRSIRIRLILITRSKLVEALGIKGQGDWRDNLVFISLDRQRRAFLEWDGTTYQIDTKPAFQLSKQRIVPARAWELPALPANKAEEFLSRLFDTNEDVPVRGIREGKELNRGGIPSATGEEALPVPPVVPADGLDDEVIKILHDAGWSMNKIASKMTKGNKQDRLARIRRAIGVIVEEV